jgi:BirA family biotin operon repressor/biotin-[acetyl-CoA-carboxylase] ligase
MTTTEQKTKASSKHKSIEQIRNQLLQALNDKQFHSGEALAEQFNLSRSAISNHVKALNSLGVEIYSVKGRGYKLARAIELLSSDLIKSELIGSLKLAKSQGLQTELIQVENIVSSTNDVIKLQINNTSGLVCMAEAQTKGRGRRGRKWVSPYGSSLYMSMLWHFDNGYQAMTGLSIMVGVVLNETLKSLGIDDCKLKWPNDIYFQQQKLAGILIEVEGQVGASTSAIIGIGVNIALPDSIEGIDQAFTDLMHANSAKPISRNVFAAKLIERLWQALPLFEAKGLAPFLDDWRQADLYINKPVVLVSGEQQTHGLSRGVDSSGALLLEVNGKIIAHHGGEISVRPA